MTDTLRNIPCFFMLCNKDTEKECLEKGLFGDREWRLPYLKLIRKGHIGFLLNVSQDQILGIFLAESSAQLNIDKDAWAGNFPAQIRVKLVGDLQRVDGATEKLEKIMQLREMGKKNEKKTYRIPYNNTYGPEITAKILSFFDITKVQNDIPPQHEEIIDAFSEFNLEDVAGLSEVKDFVYQRIFAPNEDEKTAYSLGLRIGGGMLLFGPPGTGKTIIASAIAKKMEAKFIHISPSIIVGYPGEAETRLEKIFESLDKEPRSVIFLDEAEWILCKREKQTSSIMQRVTPMLLSHISRILKQRAKPIIVIAATNKPWMIDPAFLRPGRFDKIFYVRLPDETTRKDIIKFQLRDRKYQLTEEEIAQIASKLDGYTGADIENIIQEAAYMAYMAFNKKIRNFASITKEDVTTAISRIPKSVTVDEVSKLEKWANERGLMI